VASYQQVIELVVKGQEQLGKLEQRVKKLRQEADRLTKEPAKAGTGVLADTIQEAADSQQALNKASKQNLLNQIKLNSAVDLYGRRLQQVQTTAAADQAQFKGRIAEIQAAFQAFKTDGDISGIQAVSTELGRILEYSRENQRNAVGLAKSVARRRDYVRQIKEFQKAGLDTSEAEKFLEQAKVFLGTKRFKLAEAIEVKLKERLGLLRKEQTQIDANTKAANKRKGQRSQDLALGAGFPLLFGGGAGQVLGGLGGALLGGGFGGQILGSALGQQLEDALRRIQEIDIATQTLDMDALADSAILVNAELRQTVQKLVDMGESQKAVGVAADAVLQQTGVLPESIADSANAVALLSNVWDQVVAAVSGLLSLVGTPLISALTLVLKLVGEGVKGINFFISLAGVALKRLVQLIRFIPGGSQLLQGIENATKGINESAEGRLATARQTGAELEKELGREREIFDIEKRRVSGNTAAAKLTNAQAKRDEALARLRFKTEDQVVRKREELADLQGRSGEIEREYQVLLINRTAELEQQRILRQYALDEEAAGIQRAKELAKQQAKETKQALDAQKQALQTNLNVLKNTLSIETERNNLALSKIKLDQTLSNIRLKDFGFIQAAREAGLSELEQLKLMGVERLNSLNIEERLALVRQSGAAMAKQEEEIFKRQLKAKLKAAKIEYDAQLLSIDASVSKAKIEEQLTQIKNQQLQIQLTSLRIEAQGIKNANDRANAFDEINRQQALVNQQTAEITRLAKDNLNTAIQQADIQRQIAKNKYEELKATIRSEELERRRSQILSQLEAKSAKIAQNTQAAAEASNQISSSKMLGQKDTVTYRTSIPIDEDVRRRVEESAPPFGFRRVIDLINKLEEEQKRKNARLAAEEERAQRPQLSPGRAASLSSSSFRSSAFTGQTPYGSNNGDTTVNVNTGPVMEFNDKRYVSMDDFEAGLREVSRSTAKGSRNYGARRYAGVR